MFISVSSLYSPTGYSAQANAAQNSKNASAPLSQIQANGDSARQQSEIQSLKNRDMEVRNHEQAHLNAAGSIAVSGAKYSYATGPDGKLYATGGDVGIDTSPVTNDPEATIRKAETIRRAALAPANPSAQDYKVAAMAAEMANKAGMELLQSQQQKQPKGSQLNVRA